MQKKRILVAALNWGLGHATRCIPIIKALLKNDYEPVLASDGDALRLLKKEFPHIICLELPSYNIKYTEDPGNLKWKLLFDIPRILNVIKAEKKMTWEHRVFERMDVFLREYGLESRFFCGVWTFFYKKRA